MQRADGAAWRSSVLPGTDDRCMGTAFAIPVEVLSAHHDSLDYVASLGGVAGGIAGIAALVFAARSAKDSSVSAAASEKSAEIAGATLDIMRAEIAVARDLRAMRAIPTVSLRAETRGSSPDAPAALVVLIFRFANKGDRSAERLLAHISFPGRFDRVDTCDQDGTPTDEGPVRRLSGRPDEDDPGGSYWVRNIGPLEPWDVGKLQYFRLDNPPAGAYVLDGELMNEDLPGRKRSWRWKLTVPQTGNRVVVTELAGEGLPL
jgi:hypothetical protein